MLQPTRARVGTGVAKALRCWLLELHPRHRDNIQVCKALDSQNYAVKVEGR